MKDNFKLASIAVKDCRLVEDVSEHLKNNYEFAKNTIKRNIKSFRYFSENIKNNYKIALIMVKESRKGS